MVMKDFRAIHLDEVQGTNETRNKAYFFVRRVSIEVRDAVIRQEQPQNIPHCGMAGGCSE